MQNNFSFYTFVGLISYKIYLLYGNVTRTFAMSKKVLPQVVTANNNL